MLERIIYNILEKHNWLPTQELWIELISIPGICSEKLRANYCCAAFDGLGGLSPRDELHRYALQESIEMFYTRYHRYGVKAATLYTP